MTPEKHAGGRELKVKAVHTTEKIIAVTTYLWVLFALFALYKRALLRENGIDYWDQGYAIFNALILGKILLIGDAINIGDRLRRHALVWVVLGRSLIFAAVILLVHAVEEMVRAWMKGLPVADSVVNMGGGSWLGVYAYAAILFIMLIPLAAFREVSYVLGGDVLWKLMTGRERSS